VLVTALNAVALLTVWEEGGSQLPVQRALTLLTAAWPDTADHDWARVSVGERDGGLLRLREELFGSRLEATAVCPRCGERLDLTFSTRDIVAPPTSPDPDGELGVEDAGYTIRYRLATSADLLEIATAAATDARDALLQRCVLEARFLDAAVEPASLPDDVVKTVVEHMARADAQADVHVALDCPACSHQWSMPFDILSYLWSEIDDWARRLLFEVHTLARAYGWSERDIVGMSAQRRRLYLELAGA
jgi:hypothetical protein